MVKLKTIPASPDAWVENLAAQRGREDTQQLHTALILAQGKDPALLNRGVHIAEILLSLELDSETLAAALLYPLLQEHEIHHDTIAEKFGDRVKKILVDAMQMQSLERFKRLSGNQHSQIENLRKILLAMVTDIRAVIIILAERLVMLREAKSASPEEQLNLAKQTMNIYAPLANRLGIWQLKWEMEDMCLRYTEPETYKTIATGLADKRAEREVYIQNAMQTLTHLLQEHQVKNFKVSGRIKHIYSIYSKMRRKGANLQQIYDVSAMRVLVPTVDDCYTVMGVLHHTWQHIPAEFDDYITQPKPNGYQSIHTVIVGPEDKAVEIQIRTYAMHDTSELGVASHWSYKENVKSGTNYEEKIALLREVMAWQKEISVDASDKSNVQIKDLFSDRVYVFTPLGDIIDLPSGATPLDFAYAVHSEIGHRCRGAKVNGKLVQLTYPLKTGERIEIQTTKIPHPSRDWLNPHKGYVKTVRARNHIQHWFRTNEPTEKPVAAHEQEVKTTKPKKPKSSVHGALKSFTQNVSSFLTKFSRCCKPLPGDRVIGYITQRAGLSVHRMDCNNFLHLKSQNPERVLVISMTDKSGDAFPIELEILGNRNAKLVQTITTSLANANIHIIAISENLSKDSANAIYLITLRIHSIDEMNKAIKLLHHIPDLIEVKRR